VTGDQEPGSALSRRILDLGHKIDEIERVLTTWPSEDAEATFVRALGASVERLRDELAQARDLLERRRRADQGVDVADGIEDDLTPSDALDLSPNRAMSPSTAALARRQRTGPPKTHVFHIPWARDVEVTEDEWDHIQQILGSRSPESTP
jgi:hypothetical protein